MTVLASLSAIGTKLDNLATAIQNIPAAQSDPAVKAAIDELKAETDQINTKLGTDEAPPAA